MKNCAHTKDGKTFISEEECQELKEHLDATATYAKEKAAVFGAAEIGEVLGRIHDVGKYSNDFQRKIRGEIKSRVQHAIAGAYVLDNKYGNTDYMAKLFGIAIASHHTGLSDWGTDVDMDTITYLGKLRNYKRDCLPYEEDIKLPEKLAHRVDMKWQPDNNIAAFQVASYIRMLFSVLVDSDFTDTEEYCKGIKRETSYPSIDELFVRLMESMPKNDGSPINEIRAWVLNDCLKAAKAPQGIYTLTVPTGGGKTLASLAFALSHAAERDLRRIIYVIPYTSIIEQNAGVIKSKLGEENVLEHHAGITADDDDFETHWATENWDIPIVATTNVQFFESLFSNKTSKLRKIHNIAKSVIIFDEAQMLPTDYLSPCMAIISELVENYGVTAVLCSATQPVVHKYMFDNIKSFEIASEPDKLAEMLKRVEYCFVGKKTDDEIVAEIAIHPSILVVVNTKEHAFTLYNSTKEVIGQEGLFYLSTLLTPAHRSEKLKQIKERLAGNLPVSVISTQLIEAGVDVDFPVVIRSLAGIDSIIQAGGRANREGKLKDSAGNFILGKVIVFEPNDDNGRMPGELKGKAIISKNEVIECFGDKAFGLDGIKSYFELLYSTLERDNIMDKKGILTEFERSRGQISKMNFASVADKFKLIEDENTCGVVISCDESRSLIASLRKGDCGRSEIRKLQKHTVSIYCNQFARLKNDNAIKTIGGVNVLVTEKYYSKETGLDVFSDENKNAEALFG
jgi:CRISPR-associated endonuclease/helicase Cas3